MEENRINYLVQRYAANSATGDEVEELFNWLRHQDNDDMLQMQMENIAAATLPDKNYDPDYWEPFIQNVLNKEKAPVRVMPVRWKYYVAAAAFIIAIATTAYWWIYKTPNHDSLAGNVQVKTDVLPGKNGAVLTLSDGRKLVLDSLGNGLVTSQGGTTISLKNNSVIYDASGDGKEVLFNTMTTPNGRQYQLKLPDGSVVWLNAASSITYPTAFTGNQRNVTITGEAYFEIAKDVKKPFYVSKGETKVQVLGTHFNMNAYDDESAMKVTLLEGAVKVSKSNAANVLQPGQQAVVAAGISVVKNIDVDKVMAWKNGVFNFEGISLKEVMRQLERWYDIEVVYEGAVPDIDFYGELSRNNSLGDVIDALKDSDVHFRMEGKKLIVFK